VSEIIPKASLPCRVGLKTANFVSLVMVSVLTGKGTLASTSTDWPTVTQDPHKDLPIASELAPLPEDAQQWESIRGEVRDAWLNHRGPTPGKGDKTIVNMRPPPNLLFMPPGLWPQCKPGGLEE